VSPLSVTKRAAKFALRMCEDAP